MSNSRNPKRRLFWNLARAVISFGLLAYVVSQITWQDRLLLGTAENPQVVWGWLGEVDGRQVLQTRAGEMVPIPADVDPAHVVVGFWSLLKTIDLKWLLLALVCYPLVISVTARRWQWLLQTHGLDPGFFEAVRLTWMGLLTNNVMPGASGGDVVKAACIYRRTPTKRLHAVMTVFLDRLLGLISMMIVGGVALMISADRPEIQEQSRYIPLLLLTVLVGGLVFFSGRLRRLLRISAIIDRLPFTDKLHQFDQSVFHYRKHPWTLLKAVAISLPVHLGSFACVWMLGLALGLNIAAIHYFAFLPGILTFGAVIPAIGGLGVLEGGFQYFFSLPGVGATPSGAVALCIVFRFMGFATSLPGAWPLYREFSVHGVPKAGEELPAPDVIDQPISNDGSVTRCGVA